MLHLPRWSDRCSVPQIPFPHLIPLMENTAFLLFSSAAPLAQVSPHQLPRALYFCRYHSSCWSVPPAVPPLLPCGSLGILTDCAFGGQRPGLLAHMARPPCWAPPSGAWGPGQSSCLPGDVPLPVFPSSGVAVPKLKAGAWVCRLIPRFPRLLLR